MINTSACADSIGLRVILVYRLDNEKAINKAFSKEYSNAF